MAKEKSTNDEKEKTSFFVRKETIKAIKYISYADERTQTDIVEQALTRYVKEWEEKNGAIPPKPVQ